MGQLGFYDLDKRLKALSAKGDALEALNALIPFESFRAEIEAVVRLAPEARKSEGGPWSAASVGTTPSAGCCLSIMRMTDRAW